MTDIDPDTVKTVKDVVRLNFERGGFFYSYNLSRPVGKVFHDDDGVLFVDSHKTPLTKREYAPAKMLWTGRIVWVTSPDDGGYRKQFRTQAEATRWIKEFLKKKSKEKK